MKNRRAPLQKSKDFLAFGDRADKLLHSQSQVKTNSKRPHLLCENARYRGAAAKVKNVAVHQFGWDRVVVQRQGR